MDFSVIGPIIGALGIGSLITQYLMAGRSRREVRGAVLKQLAEVEEKGWAGAPDDRGYRDFQKALHALETAALTARIPRHSQRELRILYRNRRRTHTICLAGGWGNAHA